MITVALRMTSPRKDPSVRDEGVAALEFVLWIPVLLLALGLAVVAGRLGQADGEVHGAARAAARAASVQRSDAAAQAAANDAAATALAQAGVTCRNFHLELSLAGAGGLDEARLTCTVPLAGLGWIGSAASRTMTSTFDSPVDTYRETGT